MRWPEVQGGVTFRDVAFAYPSRPDAPVLKGVSFDVPAGTVAAGSYSVCVRGVAGVTFSFRHRCSLRSKRRWQVDPCLAHHGILRTKCGLACEAAAVVVAHWQHKKR